MLTAQIIPEVINKESIELFLKERPLKPNSQRAYRTDLAVFWDFCKSRTEISFDDLRTWIQGFSTRSGGRRFTNIRQYLLWLEEKGLLQLDAIWHLPLKRPEYSPVKPEKPAILSAHELALLADPGGLSLKKRTLITLLIEAAPSLEELAALTWQQVTLTDKGYLEIGQDSSRRLISLSRQTIGMLQDLRNEDEEDGGSLEAEGKTPVFLMQSQKGGISASYMALYLRRILKKVLLRDISPTELVEFARRRLIEKAGALQASQILGKKRLYSLFKDQRPPDLIRLRQVHDQIFQCHKSVKEEA